jgi:hypothetical protein
MRPETKKARRVGRALQQAGSLPDVTWPASASGGSRRCLARAWRRMPTGSRQVAGESRTSWTQFEYAGPLSFRSSCICCSCHRKSANTQKSVASSREDHTEPERPVVGGRQGDGRAAAHHPHASDRGRAANASADPWRVSEVGAGTPAGLPGARRTGGRRQPPQQQSPAQRAGR